MRVVAFAVVLMLVGPVVAATTGSTAQHWDDLAGGGQRTGAAFLPTATLDALDSRDLAFEEGQIFSITRAKGLVATPHGLLGLAYNNGDCIHLIITENDMAETVLDQCQSATMEGYDRTNDRFFACSEGGPDDFIFQSRDASTGDFVWGIRPSDVFEEGGRDIAWDCNGSALDPESDAVYVILFAIDGECVENQLTRRCVKETTHTVLLRIKSSDGSVDWMQRISTNQFYARTSPEVDELGISMRPYSGQGGGFSPKGLSLVEGGVVVSGRIPCICDKGDLDTGVQTVQAAIAWFRASDGEMIGRVLAEDDVSGQNIRDRVLGPWWAPTQGPLAGFALGNRVILINYAENSPVRQAPFDGIETGDGFIGVLPATWWDDSLLIPMGESVTSVNSQNLEAEWSWVKGESWRVSAMVMVPPGDVWILVVQNTVAGGPNAATMHRLDLATGDELQRLDVPGPIINTGGLGRAQFQPMDDGRLLVYTLNGQIYTFGPSNPEDQPLPVVSNDYPAVVDPTTISIHDPASDANYAIAWGDGQLEAGGTSWTHRYGASGDHIARVTATYPDGTTATTEHTIHVGGTPPPELNALQRAFANENQDLTFGILGIAVTLLGALIAVLLRRRRHGFLRKELDRLHGIGELSRGDPAAGARELSAFRYDMVDKLSSRKLSDAQYTLIESRAGSIADVIRRRILGPVASKLTASFHHSLDLVLLDGRFERGEVDGLLTAMAAEKQLTTTEKKHLGGSLRQLID